MPDIFSGNSPVDNTHEEPTQPVAAVPQVPVQSPAQSTPVGMFTTFSKYPSGVTFAQQDQDETIILFLRRDLVTNVPWIIATIVLLFVPFLIRFIFLAMNFSLGVFPFRLIVVLVIFYYLIVIGFAFANLVSWFYNIGIVTNKRAVDIDFYDISTINVVTAVLPDIKDVAYNQAGFFRSFFDYADVSLQIEASSARFVFEKVPRPSEVSGIISQLIGRQGNND